MQKLITLAVAALVLGACSGLGSHDILGRWQRVEPDGGSARYSLEFFPDGSFITTTTPGPSLGGEWVLFEGRRLKLDLPEDVSYALDVEISDDEMVFAGWNGDHFVWALLAASWHRVRE